MVYGYVKRGAPSLMFNSVHSTHGSKHVIRSAFKKRRGWCLVKMNMQLLTQFILEVCLLIKPWLLNRVSSWYELFRTTLGCPRIFFGKVGQSCFVLWKLTPPWPIIYYIMRILSNRILKKDILYIFQLNLFKLYTYVLIFIIVLLYMYLLVFYHVFHRVLLCFIVFYVIALTCIRTIISSYDGGTINK